MSLRAARCARLVPCTIVILQCVISGSGRPAAERAVRGVPARPNAATRPVAEPGASRGGADSPETGRVVDRETCLRWAREAAVVSMERYWDDARGCYTSPVQESSLTNVMMVQAFSILAGADLLGPTHRRRCRELLNVLLEPPVNDGLEGISLYLSTNDEAHISISGPYCTALSYAWRYANALGLEASTRAKLAASVEQQVQYLRAQLVLNRTGANQTALRWGPEAAAAAYAMTGDERYCDVAREFLDEFFRHYDRPAPGHARPFLNGDWTWIYDSLAKRAQASRRSEYDFTYLSHCSAGVWFFQSMGGRLSAEETAVANALLHTSLAHWTIGGYPQWISSQLEQRSFSTNYWAWCFYSLAALATWDGGDDALRGTARHIFDNSAALFREWLLADPTRPDDAHVANPYGVPLAETPSLNRHADLAIAMYAAYLAMAAEMGVADTVPASQPRVWNYEFETTNLYVSTPAYGMASGNEILKAYYESRGDITLLYHGNGRLLSPAYTQAVQPPPQWSLCVEPLGSVTGSEFSSDQRRPNEWVIHVDGDRVQRRPYDVAPRKLSFERVVKTSRWRAPAFGASVTLTALPDRIVRRVEVAPRDATPFNCYVVFPSRVECQLIETLHADGAARPLCPDAPPSGLAALNTATADEVVGWHFSYGEYGYAVILLRWDGAPESRVFSVFSPPAWEWDAGRGPCVRLDLWCGAALTGPLRLTHAILFTDGRASPALLGAAAATPLPQ